MSMNVDEIRERCERATPGPWKAIKGISETDDLRCGVTASRGKTEYLVATIENGAPGDFCETEEANADFIAHARTDIPALCDALAASEKRVRELEEALRPISPDDFARLETAFKQIARFDYPQDFRIYQWILWMKQIAARALAPKE